MKPGTSLREKFIQKVRAVAPVPESYYAGRRRWAGAFPDNVLLFLRNDRHGLDSDHLSSYFHHRWVLLVAMEGRATVQVNGAEHCVRPDSVLLIPPLHLHYYHSVDEGKLCWLYITFDWPGQTAPADSELGPHDLAAEALTHLTSLMEQWFDKSVVAGTLLSAEVMSLLHLLFPAILAQAPQSPAEEPRSALVTAVQREVAKAQERMLSINDLAAGVGISASHLRAEFRAHTGISLGRYLREWKLREAALLLSTQDLSVKETAERLGFRDIYAFSRAFSRAFGVPPSSFRSRNPASGLQER